MPHNGAQPQDLTGAPVMGADYSKSPPQLHVISTDSTGAINVVGGGGGGGNPAAGPTGSPVPADADYIGINVGGNLVGVSAANPLPISGSISATNPSVSTTGAAVPASATMVGGTDGTNLRALSTNAAGQLQIEQTDGTNVLGTPTHPVRVDPTGTTVQPVSGSVSILDGGGSGYKATVFDFGANNPVTDLLAVALFDGSGEGPPTINVATSGTNNALSVSLTDTAGTPVNTTDDGSGNLNVNIQAAGLSTGLPTLPSEYSPGIAGINPSVAISLQSDSYGSLFVKPFRRSQTVSKGTTIALSGSATSVLPVQGSGVFADITQLVITATPAAVTAVSFTATLSDGTATYIFDINTGVVGTLAQPPLVINFNPALPATTANTAWTVTLSSSSVTVHITVVAVLQQAS